MRRLRNWLLGFVLFTLGAIWGEIAIGWSRLLIDPARRLGSWMSGVMDPVRWGMLGIILALVGLVVWLVVTVTRRMGEMSRAIAIRDRQIAWFDALASFLQSFATQIDKLDLDPRSDDDVRRILKKLLSDIKRFLPGESIRPYILRPDGDFLVPYDESQLPAADGYKRAFYIGSDARYRSGVAGAAFKSKELQVAHLVYRDGDWVCDHPEYVVLHEHAGRPPYLSFICVPMTDEGREPFGVLCIDGYGSELFDAPDVQNLIVLFTWVIGRAIIVSEELTQKRQQRRVGPPARSSGQSRKGR